MITVTLQAETELRKLMSDQDPNVALRVFVSPGGCSGGGQCTAPTACGGVVPCATSMSSGAACGQSTPAPGAACIPTQDNSFCTTVEGEPWDIFTSNIAAIYYF